MYKATPETLSTIMNSILADYNKRIVEEVKTTVSETMKELVTETKTTVSKTPLKNRAAGTYAKHIASKPFYKSPTGYSEIWYVKSPEYRLTHLINNGHALHQGGRAAGSYFLTNAANTSRNNFEAKIIRTITHAST